MTRTELYLALTEALAAAKPRTLADGPEAHDQWGTDCEHIATALAAHHQGFDRARFLADCAR